MVKTDHNTVPPEEGIGSERNYLGHKRPLDSQVDIVRPTFHDDDGTTTRFRAFQWGGTHCPEDAPMTILEEVIGCDTETRTEADSDMRQELLALAGFGRNTARQNFRIPRC